MTTPYAVAAYLGWQKPLSHRADCTRPSWEVTTQTAYDQHWGRFDEGGHTCPNEDCLHGDRFDRLTVRIVCLLRTRSWGPGVPARTPGNK